MAPEIIAPVFIVGCHRSGTSIFYRKFALHPDLASITRTTRKVPNSLLLMRLFMLFRSQEKNYTPIGGEVWNKFAPHNEHALDAKNVTPQIRRYYQKVVQNHLILFNKKRFLNKSPSNSVKLGFLNEIFPDAFFIHLVRDGRAVSHSILRGRRKHGRFSGARFPGWQEIMDKPIVESCGLQWKRTLEYILNSVKILSADRFMQVRYEDFIIRPRETMLAIGEKCGLKWSDKVLDQVAEGLENRNYKWSANFDQTDIELLNALLGDLLEDFRYEVK